MRFPHRHRSREIDRHPGGVEAIRRSVPDGGTNHERPKMKK